MSVYELAILGSPSETVRQTLLSAIEGMVSEFDLTVGREVTIHDATSLSSRDKHAAFAAAYFGGVVHTDLDAAREAADSSAPVIPVIEATGDFGAHIPDFLQAANGLRRKAQDPNMNELAVALLECVGLLRTQRRVFVSYRRTEARLAAVQLHDVLSARGFDVFLDTHDIRPGEPFQDVLWHRLCDSDVLVMLDTPTYFDSKWTRQEIGRARAKEIHILRVVWPLHTPNKMTDLSETAYLEEADLLGPEGPLRNDAIEAVIVQVERLRSRSIASRHMSIAGKLRADVEKIGATFEGIGAHRAMRVRLVDDRHIWAYPVVGIPTAETLYDISEKARRSDHEGTPILVYDHLGMRESWNAHLKWLDENISSVRAVKVSEAGWALAGWEA